MYCKHCGKELPEEAVFCENCGTSAITGKRKQSAGQIKKRKLWLVLGIAALVAVVGISMLADYLKMCIDPTEYVTVKAFGISGGGTVEVFFDKNDLLRDKIEGINPEDKAWNESFLEEADPIRVFGNMFFEEERESIVDSLFFTSVNQEEITNGMFQNGDTIVVDIHVNQELLETYGFHTMKDEYQMEFIIGEDTPLLKEPVYIDIFEYLDLQIVGDDGNGRIIPMGTEGVFELQEPVDGISAVTMEITPRDDAFIADIHLKMLDAEGKRLYSGTVGVLATQATGLHEGDETIVSFYELDWVLEKGIGFLETEKTFKAEGLSEEGRLDVFRYLRPVFSGKNGEGNLTWELTEKDIGFIGAVTDISLALQPGSYSGQTLLVVHGKNTKGNDIQCTFELCTTWNPSLENGDTVSAYIAEKGRDSSDFRELGVLFSTSGYYQVSGLE